MKPIRILILFIIISFLISACATINTGVVENIQSPKNKLIPISGIWIIEKVKPEDKVLSEEQLNKWIDKKIILHEKIAVVADEYCIEPTYKIKNVNPSDYLLYQYKANPKHLGITSSTIQIITVTSEKQLFYELIKTEDNQIIIIIDGTFFYLKKISDEIDDSYINEYLKQDKEIVGKDRFKNEGILSSGVLLGLKSYEKSNVKESDGEWAYRTIWIPSNEGVIDNIYETKDLFVPRKSGFWKLGMKDKENHLNRTNTLFAYPIDKEINKEINKEIDKEIDKVQDENDIIIQQKLNESINILYVGTDYISIEYREKINGKQEEDNLSKNLLKVLPIDNIANAKAIKISDIAGSDAKDVLNESAINHVTSNMDNKSKYLNVIPEEESFAVVRRNGHWIMRGRLNFSEKGGTDIDFNIKVIPPLTLVAYDELCLSWNGIKLKVPEVTDAYTSPNEDVAILITNNNILVYAIKNNELSQEPLRRIKLKDKETVIMAEWAEGKYTEKWNNEFLKNDVNSLSN